MSYPAAPAFRAAGYQNILVPGDGSDSDNDDDSGTAWSGMVRQHANVSFSRVFEAGHSVAYYQPETVYYIFNRAIFGRDIATGTVAITPGKNANYSSKGPASSMWRRNEPPDSPPTACWLYEPGDSCTDDQKKALANGTAIVEKNIVVCPSGLAARDSK